MSADTNSDPDLGDHHYVDVDSDGRFRLEKLVPGQPYFAEIYQGAGGASVKVFESVALRSGEVRDLGDIHIKRAQDARKNWRTTPKPTGRTSGKAAINDERVL